MSFEPGLESPGSSCDAAPLVDGEGGDLAEIIKDPVKAALTLADIGRGMVVATEFSREHLADLLAVVDRVNLTRARYLRAAEREAIDAGRAVLSDPLSASRAA